MRVCVCVSERGRTRENEICSTVTRRHSQSTQRTVESEGQHYSSILPVIEFYSVPIMHLALILSAINGTHPSARVFYLN